MDLVLLRDGVFFNMAGTIATRTCGLQKELKPKIRQA